MASLVLQCMRSFPAISSRTTRVAGFGTFTVLRNKDQSSSEGSSATDVRPDETFQKARNSARQQQRRDRERPDSVIGVMRPVNNIVQRSARPVNRYNSQQQGTRGGPVSIFDRLTKQSKPTREGAEVGEADVSISRNATPKRWDSGPTKPVHAEMRRVTIEHKLPSESHWFAKQRDMGIKAPNQQQNVRKDGRKTQPSHAADSDEVDSLYRSIQMEITGHDEAVLRSYAEFLRMTVQGLGLSDSLERLWTVPRRFYRRTLLKSNFVHKLHRRQYEIRTYYLLARFVRLTGSTAETLLEYTQRNLPEGTAMKLSYERIEALPSRILQAHAAATASSAKNADTANAQPSSAN